MNKKILTLITSLIWSAIYDSSSRKNIITYIIKKCLVQKITKKIINYNKITAIANLKYFSIKLKEMKVWSNINTKDIDVYNENYQIVEGRGKAETIKKIYKNRYKFIKNFFFTNFSIVESEFISDIKNNIITIWNTRFKVPFFYINSIHIPVSDKRYSGFILPSLKKNINGLIFFNIPLYLNISKNYYFTINTCMSKRGNKLHAELRYFNNQDKGLIEFYLLPNDKKYNYHNDELKNNNNNSLLLYCKYKCIKYKLFIFNIHYTKLSNLKYFNDIESKYCSSSSEGYTNKKLFISYTYKNFNTYLSSKKFTVLKNGITNIYSVTPQLDIIYYKKNIYPFNLKIITQAAKFTNLSSNYPETLRLHIEQKINFKLSNSWGILNTEAKLMMTHFNQKNIDKYNNNNNHYLYSKVNRFLPQFKTEINIFLYRYRDYSSYYIQTLEPRFQYLYVPYCNQNNIFIYNSTILHKDNTNLFIDKKYSNIDRILSANQLTSCFTTIIYDYSLNEKFRASVGQIYYLSQKIENKKQKKLIFTGDSYWSINNKFIIQCGIQYDSCIHRLTLGDAILESKIDKKNIFKIHYRYINKKYILIKKYQPDIAQVGITYNWKPIDNWSIVGSYLYDSQFNKQIKQLLFIEYKTCCWSINIAYERKIFNLNNKKNKINNYNNKIFFKFKLLCLNR